MHLSIITHYCVPVVVVAGAVVVVIEVVVVVAVVILKTISINEKSISTYLYSCNLWLLYFPNIDNQPFRSVIMTSKATWHDIQGHMIIEQWIEYVI